MSNDGPTKEAKKALCALLQRLNINKVVCVDDEHASPLTLDDILSWLETSSPEELISAFPEFKGPVSQDPDILKESFRKWWKGLELKQKDEFSNQARPFVQEEAKAESPDVDYMSILSEVFQGIDDITFSPLNLQEWHRQSEGLLAAPDCSQILFLFDRDVSKGGGDPMKAVQLLVQS